MTAGKCFLPFLSLILCILTSCLLPGQKHMRGKFAVFCFLLVIEPFLTFCVFCSLLFILLFLSKGWHSTLFQSIIVIIFILQQKLLITVQSKTRKSNVLGKNIFLRLICYLTYLSTTDSSNFAERTSTQVYLFVSFFLFYSFQLTTFSFETDGS